MTPVHETPPRQFSLSVRVYYEDTDAAGIVYHAGYLRFLERGRTEWLRALGVEQSRLARDGGISFAVRSLNIEYRKAARLDDVLGIVTEVESLRRAQMVFAQRIEREGELLVEATVRVACIDSRLMKPAAIPRQIRNKMGIPA
jgi:acyl-CoA thioester hydrolase